MPNKLLMINQLDFMRTMQQLPMFGLEMFHGLESCLRELQATIQRLDHDGWIIRPQNP